MPEKIPERAPVFHGVRAEFSERALPERVLLGYACGECKESLGGAGLPYFKALAALREHNLKDHGSQFPAPKIVMAYKP